MDRARARSLLLVASVIGAHALASADAPIPAGNFAHGTISNEAIATALASAHPDNFRPLGNTSVLFQMQLTGPIDAAYKPESGVHPRGYRAEIAASRIGAALGLDDVPLAVPRIVDRQQLRRRLDPDYEGDVDRLFSQIGWNGGVTRGAAIYWIPDMVRGDLDTPEGIARWSGWLDSLGDVPSLDRALARDLSNAFLFDAVIGNADRMSGGNVRIAEYGGVTRLMIRDHNLAFPHHWSAAQRDRILEPLRHVERVSRSFVAALRTLDRARLDELNADETLGPILEEEQLVGVLDRRAMVLSYVDALVAMQGEDATLVFD